MQIKQEVKIIFYKYRLIARRIINYCKLRNFDDPRYIDHECKQIIGFVHDIKDNPFTKELNAWKLGNNNRIIHGQRQVRGFLDTAYTHLCVHTVIKTHVHRYSRLCVDTLLAMLTQGGEGRPREMMVVN